MTASTIWTYGETLGEALVTTERDPELGILSSRLPARVFVDTANPAAELPAKLTGNQQLCPDGSEEIVFRSTLDAGFYTFTLHCLEQTEAAIYDENNAFPLSRGSTLTEPFAFDGKLRRERVETFLTGHVDEVVKERPEKKLRFVDVDEIDNRSRQAYVRLYVNDVFTDSFELPAAEFVRGDNNRFEPRAFAVTFFVADAGPISLRLQAVNRWCLSDPTQVFSICQTQRLFLTGAALTTQALPAPFNSFDHAIPGRPLHQFWSYELCTSFMRPDNNEVGPERFAEVLDECFQWGATHFDVYWSHCKPACYPPGSKCGHPMEWSEDDPLAGAEYYNQTQDSLWNNQSLAALTRQCHEKGLTIDWYQHLPMCPATIDGREHDGWDPPVSWRKNFISVICREFADVLIGGWRNTLDAYQEESGNGVCSVDLLLQLHWQWAQHPGMAMLETSAARTDRIIPGILPNFTAVPTNSHLYHDRIAWDNYRFRDLSSEYGEQQLILQANSRAEGDVFLRERKDDRGLGTANPDEVLQQLNDFFRANLTQGSKRFGIWWLAESANVLPDELRDYVRGASMFPIRAAVAMPLTTHGRGGAMDRHTQMHPVQADIHDSHAANTPCIGNNYLRAYLDTDGQQSELLIDPEGLARFGHCSSQQLIGNCLFETRAMDGRVAFRQETESEFSYLEKAGYLASLRETRTAAIPYAKQSYVETRTWQLAADSPLIELTIERQRSGVEHDLRYCWPAKRLSQRLLLPGYDQCEVEGHSEQHLALAISDSRGLLPDLLVWIDGEDVQYDFCPYEQLEFSVTSGAEERFRIVMGLRMAWLAKYAAGELPGVAGIADSDVLSNDSDKPVVRVAKVRRTKAEPWLVGENGHWLFRGAQVSAQEPAFDFVPAYLPPGAGAAIRPWGWLENRVKPGWGCQNMLAIGEISVGDGETQVVVEVLATNAMIFAPRLQFTEPIAAATVDGKAWFYMDDDVLFLPNRPGRYEVRLQHGESMAPSLVATYGIPRDFVWDGSRFACELALPPQTRKLPASVSLYAAVRFPTKRSSATIGAGKLIRETDHGVIVATAGQVELSL